MDSRTAVYANPALDSERLKYLTKHFYQLQGLTPVPFGVVFVASPLVSLYGINWSWHDLTFKVTWTAFVMAAVHYLQKYYRHRFGWIEPPPIPRTLFSEILNRQEAKLLAGLVLVIIGGEGIDRFLDWITAVVYSRIPAHLWPFFPVLAWFLYMCFAFRRNPQREELYRMYFVYACALAWTFVALYPIWHRNLLHPLLWEFLNHAWIGLSLIVVGLYNHFTLVRLMPKQVAVGDNDDE